MTPDISRQWIHHGWTRPDGSGGKMWQGDVLFGWVLWIRAACFHCHEHRRIHWRYKQRQTCPDNTKYLSRVCRLSFQMQLTLDREDAFAGPFQDSRFLPEALLAEKAMPMGIFQSRWHSSDILSIIIYICIFVCYYLWISLHTLRLQALDETVASEVQQMQAGRCSRKTVRVKGFKGHYAVRTGQGLVDQPRDISTWHACFVRSTVFCNFLQRTIPRANKSWTVDKSCRGHVLVRARMFVDSIVCLTSKVFRLALTPICLNQKGCIMTFNLLVEQQEPSHGSSYSSWDCLPLHKACPKPLSSFDALCQDRAQFYLEQTYAMLYTLQASSLRNPFN